MAGLHLFSLEQPGRRGLSRGDLVAFLTLAVLLFAAIRLALGAPAVIQGPDISLAPTMLPYYAGLSVGRMAAAYALSMLFTLVYGYVAANSRRAEQVLMPLLDVLQSVPLLSFLPVVLLGLSAILPQGVAAEVASVVLIFTSQAWNLTFSWYQSLTTVPKDLREASTVFRFSPWLRLRTIELPFATISLVWNSMMSWAGGWFFLMAAEIFTVGQRDFRLPGLGSYLKEAADQGNLRAVAWGLATLVLVIVALDQLVWRPLLAWSDRFKLEMVEGESGTASWFHDALRTSAWVAWIGRKLVAPAIEQLDRLMQSAFPVSTPRLARARRPWGTTFLALTAAAALAYGAYQAGRMLTALPLVEWGQIVSGLGWTLLRVAAALLIAIAWTIPVGVAIGSSPRLARWLQPVVQITASVPATALFPVVLLFLLSLPGGLNLAAVLLMLMGTQWYLLFNVIAGTTAIPQDLRNTTDLLQLSRRERWLTLILPALFPYIVTGAITASGGAWNASIVAEYVEFGGQAHATPGIGALIALATVRGDYPLLLAATLSMILAVVVINRLVWRRMYRLAEAKYRVD